MGRCSIDRSRSFREWREGSEIPTEHAFGGALDIVKRVLDMTRASPAIVRAWRAIGYGGSGRSMAANRRYARGFGTGCRRRVLVLFGGWGVAVGLGAGAGE